MNRITVFWLFLCCSSAWFGVARATDFPPDLQRIKDRGELLVAAYAGDIPPFLFIDATGELAGVDVDVAQSLAAALGVRLRFLRTADRFDELTQVLLDRKADVVISAFSRSVKRALSLRFTEPYVRLGRVLFVNRTATVGLLDYKSDYRNLNRPEVIIGANEGGVYADLAQELFPNASVRLYKTHRDGTVDMLEGKLHAYLCDQPCANAYNRPDPWRKIKPPDNWGLKIRTIPLQSGFDPISMAVHHEDAGMHAFLNVFLEENRNNGTLGAITAKHHLTEGRP
jgi:polar amino acid transport system substrate-binding protein